MKPIRRKKEYHHTGYRFPDDEQPWWRNKRRDFVKWWQRYGDVVFETASLLALFTFIIAMLMISTYYGTRLG